MPRRGFLAVAAGAFVLAASAGCSGAGDHSRPPPLPSGSTSIPPTGPGATRPAATQSAATASAAHAEPPVWLAPERATRYIRAAGLRPLSQEGTVEHYHAHLDILVDGAPVSVAADIGIDPAAHTISPLHTHDETGILHVETPDRGARYALGQLFAEWNVRLTADCMGELCSDADHVLTAWVDGRRVGGNPASIVITEHEEIALSYDPVGATPDVPSTYRFYPGM